MFGHYMFNYVPIHPWGGLKPKSKQGPSAAKVEESPWQKTAGDLWQSDSGETQTIAAWESGYVLTLNNDGTMTAELKFSGGIPPLILRRVQVMGAESATPHEHDVQGRINQCAQSYFLPDGDCTEEDMNILSEKDNKIREVKDMLYEMGGYTGNRNEEGIDTQWFPNTALKWCVCGDKFHISWMDDGGTHGVTSDDTLITRSAYITPATEEEVKFELRKSQDYGDHWTPHNYGSYRVNCSDMDTKVDCADSSSNSSGSSSNSSGKNNSKKNNSTTETEDETMPTWLLVMIPILAGGAYWAWRT